MQRLIASDPAKLRKALIQQRKTKVAGDGLLFKLGSLKAPDHGLSVPEDYRKQVPTKGNRG